MAKSILTFSSRVGVYLLVTWLAVFAGPALSSPSGQSEGAIPTGWESYHDRPDILMLKGKSQPSSSSWQKTKNAHFSMIAQLLEMYPADTHFYLLARDSEYLYDVARLVTAGTSDENRFHLLNVSRANMHSKNLMPYLEENGISEKTIQEGKKILFVDTGFAGTIPRVISANFSESSQSQLKTQLIVSSGGRNPSSRAFLVHLNLLVNELHPSEMRGTIINYEHMSRYTDRSSEFAIVNGRTHPISQIKGAADGSVSKELSLNFMKDLKNDWQKQEVQARFFSERSQLRILKAQLIQGGESAIQEIKARLFNLNKTFEGSIYEAQVRDAIEMQANAGFSTKIRLSDLGLKIVAVNAQFLSKKNALIKQYPEWATVLENPESEIPKLFTINNWQMIGNLIDANVDFEINTFIAKSLYDAPATGIKHDYQRLFIESADQNTLSEFAKNVFSQPYAEGMKDLIRLLIEKANPSTLQQIAFSVFSQPHTKDMGDLLRVVIEKADADTLKLLAQNVFSKPHTKVMGDLLRVVIEKADQDTLRTLAASTFSEPHTKDMTDLLGLVIDKADENTLRFLAQNVFSKPHTKDKADLLRIIIDKAGTATLIELAQSTFSKPHMKDRADLLRILIEKDSLPILYQLAERTFSQPHTKDMGDLLRLVIEKSDQNTLRYLAVSTFSKPHTKDMGALLRLVIEKADKYTMNYLSESAAFQKDNLTAENLILRQSLSIGNQARRKAWLAAEFGKAKPSPSSTASTELSKAKPISPLLKPGDMIEIRGRRLEVVNLAGAGRRGVVYKVKSASGAQYALKVAKNQDADTLKSMAEESSKAKAWQALRIPHSKVLVQDKNYVLKTWIEGLKGDEVIEKFSKGDASMKAAAENALRLVEMIRNQGAYVGDFRPANLIWTGKAWVIIDSGSIQEGMTLEEAQAKWSRSDERGPKFERRWKMSPPAIHIKCVDLFSGH
jgi:hypothetical protein